MGFSIPIKCTKYWNPKPGERVYISHAITKHKFKDANFISWWDGCLIVMYNKELYRLHLRHSGMKPVLNLTINI